VLLLTGLFLAGAAGWLTMVGYPAGSGQPDPSAVAMVTDPAMAAGGAAADATIGDGSPARGGPVTTREIRVGRLTLTVEVADTPAARAHGLMGRTSLPAGTGMLFVFHGESSDSFYMYRTLLPLSIVFARQGRVVTVHEMTPCFESNPDRCEIYRADTAYTEAVEAPEGTFRNAGTRPGDMIDFGGPPSHQGDGMPVIHNRCPDVTRATNRQSEL
jgi:uncharacterized membrane protein (UPF0127 family)